MSRRSMRAPPELLPLALCGLATIVGVAIVVVLGDLLRRFVLYLIAVAMPVEPRVGARATGLDTAAPAEQRDD